jgi:hypothetical protein
LERSWYLKLFQKTFYTIIHTVSNNHDINQVFYFIIFSKINFKAIELSPDSFVFKTPKLIAYSDPIF